MTISFCTRAWLHKLLRTRSLRLQRHHEAHFYTLHATIHNKISSTSQRLCNVHKSTPSGGYPVNKRHAPHRRVQNSKKGAFFCTSLSQWSGEMYKRLVLFPEHVIDYFRSALITDPARNRADVSTLEPADCLSLFTFKQLYWLLTTLQKTTPDVCSQMSMAHTW